MKKEKEPFFKIYDNKILDMGDFKYKKCPVCEEAREYPDEFVPEGLCAFCADYIYDEPARFERYLKAVKKGYVKPLWDTHEFFSKN